MFEYDDQTIRLQLMDHFLSFLDSRNRILKTISISAVREIKVNDGGLLILSYSGAMEPINCKNNLSCFRLERTISDFLLIYNFIYKLINMTNWKNEKFAALRDYISPYVNGDKDTINEIIRFVVGLSRRTILQNDVPFLVYKINSYGINNERT